MKYLIGTIILSFLLMPILMYAQDDLGVRPLQTYLSEREENKVKQDRLIQLYSKEEFDICGRCVDAFKRKLAEDRR